MKTVSTRELDGVICALGRWQRDGAAFQLHPGDIGWHWRFGAAATAAVVRVWATEDTLGAAGFLDGPVLRLALDPDVAHDDALAAEIAADIERAGIDTVEAPAGSAIRALLGARGWLEGESWAPLEWDLTDVVRPPGLDVQVVTEDTAERRVAVHRAAFEKSVFTVEAWREMARGPAYAAARCLLGSNAEGTAVAAATVWSAGEGRPGLIEPLGVHRDHRGHGYGIEITVAAAGALRDLGCSSAIVATPAANAPGVAAYAAAGFARRPEIRDLTRAD